MVKSFSALIPFYIKHEKSRFPREAYSGIADIILFQLSNVNGHNAFTPMTDKYMNSLLIKNIKVMQ